MEDFLDGIERELRQRTATWNGEPWRLDTLYFGGGTPSRLGPTGISRLTKLISAFADLDPAAEVTLEANPEDVTGEAAEAWLEAGVNRLSVGVQSFDDAVLAWMHRVHDAARGRDAIQVARAAGFDDISLDLIFALPAHLGRRWDRDLEQAIALEPTHLSLYGLTVEDRAPLGRWRDRGEDVAAPEEDYAADFMKAHALLCSANYLHYEVSNFALPNRLAKHNSSYWRAVPYEGIGPSAHAFDGAERRWNRREYASWLYALRRGETAVDGSEFIDDERGRMERIYLGLRTSAGLDVEPEWVETASDWQSQGWATLDGTTLRLTPEGWLRLDALAAVLTVVPSRF